MRVRPHIKAAPRGEIGRPHVIEEDERSHQTARRRGQDAPDGKAAEVT
jgi:hypothetical protein